MPRKKRIFHHFGVRLADCVVRLEVWRESLSSSGSGRGDLFDLKEDRRRVCHGFFLELCCDW